MHREGKDLPVKGIQHVAYMGEPSARKDAGVSSGWRSR
jgi:hypothetical protein